MNSRKDIIWVLLTMIIFIAGCNTPGVQKQRVATQIAEISTKIQSTMDAEWTPTTLATETFASTATSSLSPSETPYPATPSLVPTHTVVTPDTRPSADDWRSWQIVPEITDNAKQIFRRGVDELKTNPHVFSRVGDCQSEPNVFMGIYDSNIQGLLADNDLYLQAAINYFKGSFGMQSCAVHDGMNVGSVLTTTWADPKQCQKGEDALDCELRVHNPSIMFINLGTNWISGLSAQGYYDYLAEIVRKLIDKGVLPVISSKADNVEGDNSLNLIMAKVARDFDVPFYNFWAAAQTLKNGGLSVEKPIYLSTSAWDLRNYYALKVLYAIGDALELF